MKLKDLKEVRDQFPEAEVKDPFVAAFIEEFDLDELEAEIRSEADEREYLYDKALNKVNQLKKERAQVLKEKVEEHPDLLLLKSRSKALHERLYSTKEGEFGKIPQVPPTGELSQKYNQYNDLIEEAKEALYNKYVVPFDNQIENAQAQLDMAKALAAAENQEWEAGRKEQE